MSGTGRYDLVDRVVDGPCWSRWRGHDSVLHRDVALLVVTADHPRQAAVGEAARQASMVSDPRFVHVYDVTQVGTDLWVVEEWVPGNNLTERVLVAPLPVEDACALGIQVAQALSAAHAQGVVHGALGPGDVRQAEDGRVKMAGLATRVLVEDPQPTPRRTSEPDAGADSWAAAAITYAAVTGRWPGSDRDGLPGTPPGTSPARPRLVRPGVPKAVDETVASGLRSPRQDPSELARDLEGVLSTVGRRSADKDRARPPRLPPGTTRGLGMGAGAALVVAAIAGALWVGLQLAHDSDASPPSHSASNAGSTPVPPTSPSSSLDITTRLDVVGGVDFDPDGDGHEEPELVPLAFDDNLATAWHTLSYRQADLAPKSGVGVVFDLGHIETVGAVRLNLLGAGTSLQVRTARTPGTRLSHFTTFGSATGLGDLVALRASHPVQARYVLVWLTRLPADGSTYRGGISEIEVARS